MYASTLKKIYEIHEELSKTENLINMISKSLDIIADNPNSKSSPTRYKTLNDILSACLKARSELQHRLRKVGLESLRKPQIKEEK